MLVDSSYASLKVHHCLIYCVMLFGIAHKSVPKIHNRDVDLVITTLQDDVKSLFSKRDPIKELLKLEIMFSNVTSPK